MEQTGWIGEFVIEIRDKITGDARTETIKNVVMNASLNAMADILVGTVPDMEIKYLALGTDNTPVTDMDGALYHEIFRTAPSAAHARVATGQIETQFTVLVAEAVGNIKEIGIFCGSLATATADTGTLMSRVLWTHTKSSSEELVIKRVDKIVRA